MHTTAVRTQKVNENVNNSGAWLVKKKGAEIWPPRVKCEFMLGEKPCGFKITEKNTINLKPHRN